LLGLAGNQVVLGLFYAHVLVFLLTLEVAVVAVLALLITITIRYLRDQQDK
jgi:hypothetical protein